MFLSSPGLDAGGKHKTQKLQVIVNFPLHLERKQDIWII